ncbi:hypothetical protein A2U01_0098584, partial [Trifolium medium]|nr:hypothetical protein [Trifolium medium]
GVSLLGEFLLGECLGGLSPYRGEFRDEVSCLLANVLIRPQVHISERLPALGLTHHGFVLCRKGASMV